MHRDTVRPIVVLYIHEHHLMFQQENAWPHVARICTQFLEAENVPIFAWPAESLDMLPIGRVWDVLAWHIRQCVPVPTNIQQLRTAIEEEWTNIPQATNDNLMNSMRRGWDTDWFWVPSPPIKQKLHMSGWPFIVGSLRYTTNHGVWWASWCGTPVRCDGLSQQSRSAHYHTFRRFVNNVWEKW